jgi:hypothetical protein
MISSLNFDIWSVAGKFFLLIAILQGRGCRSGACALSRGSVTKDENPTSSKLLHLLSTGQREVKFSFFPPPFSSFLLSSSNAEETDRLHTIHPLQTGRWCKHTVCLGSIIDRMTAAHHLPSYYFRVDDGMRVKGC